MKKIIAMMLSVMLVAGVIPVLPVVYAEDNEVVNENEKLPEANEVFAESVEEETGNEDENSQDWNQANSWRYENGVLREDIDYGHNMRANAYHPNATKRGIDVSEHQGSINWEQVKASGIDFAIIRCAYGDDLWYQDDKTFQYNVSECERLGIPYGIYIYSYATNTNQAMSEAQHVLRLVQGHNLSYPIYFDMEDNSTIGSDLAGIAQTFCNTIESAGYPVGIYANLNWFNNYLTHPCFSRWHKWVAQYNVSCDYAGAYAMWQYTSKGSVPGIVGNVDVNYQIGYPANHGEQLLFGVTSESKNYISYSAHVSDTGWMNKVLNSGVSGLVGMNRQIEAIKINLGNLEGVNLEYQTYTKRGGWSKYVTDGALSGSEGQNLPLEAMKIRLSGPNAQNYAIYYRTYVRNMGWLDWATNEKDSGSKGYDSPIEAYQIVVLKAGADAPGSTETPYKERGMAVVYQTHVQDIGWQERVSDGAIAGTTGQNKGVEALNVNLVDSDDGSIMYRAHVQDIGWQDYVQAGEMAGTTGQNKPMEAISINLTGALATEYDVYYRVHSSDFGWLGWAKNGDNAGTQGYAKKIEAIQVRVLEKDASAPGDMTGAFLEKKTEPEVKPETKPEIEYQAHVQDIGWQDYVPNGEIAGTTGQGKQLEALKIRIKNQKQDGGIEYSAHVSDIGWQDYVDMDEIAGTVGQNKSIEAISIKLTADLKSQYDVYYRVHSSDFGWLGWAKNGEKAGTQGLAKKAEAIQIELVKKGQAGPGDTEPPFIIKK